MICFRQHLAPKGYFFLLSILDLIEIGQRQSLHHCIQHTLSHGLWMHQDWCLAQHLFQVLECLFLLLVSLKRSVLFCQLDQGLCCPTKMRDESSIIKAENPRMLLTSWTSFGVQHSVIFWTLPGSVLIPCSLIMCLRKATCFWKKCHLLGFSLRSAFLSLWKMACKHSRCWDTV